MMSLDQYLANMDEAESREEAIESLAELLISAAYKSVRTIVSLQQHDFSMADILKLTEHNDEFNEVYYSIAEKLIDDMEKEA